MNHIPTTATVVQKLKRLAKTRRKTTVQSLAAAQNEVACEHGYGDWKHVTLCLEATSAGMSEPVVLSEAVSAFLSEQQALTPLEPETIRALSSGLVLAMDIKDADNERPESNPEIQECEDATSILARDIWLAVLRHEREEGLEHSASVGPDDQVQDFIDYIGNYRYFRYSGPLTFESLDDAFAGPLRDFFSAPTHVWLSGKFFDMSDVPEVRVDGRVVYSTTSTPGNPSKSVYARAAPAAQSATPQRGSSSDDFLVAKLDVRKLQPGLYEFQVSHSGQEVFSDAGFSSIADALRGAAEVTGAIRGYEVAYAGLVTGTYSVEELAATADAVAKRAVELASSLGRW